MTVDNAVEKVKKAQSAQTIALNDTLTNAIHTILLKSYSVETSG